MNFLIDLWIALCAALAMASAQPTTTQHQRPAYHVQNTTTDGDKPRPRTKPKQYERRMMSWGAIKLIYHGGYSDRPPKPKGTPSKR